nr:EAL domain-containing protein [uncultured Rhodopila sp.]
MHMLVFDDDPEIGRSVVKFAAAKGMDAMPVADAEAFWQQIRGARPEIIVLDLELGSTDGVEQLRLLARCHYTGTLVLVSGHGGRLLSTVHDLGVSLGLKIAGVLEKPLHIPALEQVFARLKAANEPVTARQLRAAIAHDEMSLEFQPIVAMASRRLKKLEALIRWDRAGCGLIPPSGFLSIAEADAATIDALADWTIGAALKAYEILARGGINVPIAVNISARNLYDLTLPERLERRLQEGGMPPEHLWLEVSETAAFKDATLTMDILSRLQLKGIRLSIDNFGTGYSSLALLRQMPFSEIKIDRSFVSDMTVSRDSRAIVKSIIELAVNMETDCVAEGVETRETADALEQLGACDLQGFWIARPMPVEAVPSWLAIWNRRAPPVGRADGLAGVTEIGQTLRDPPVPAVAAFEPSEADAVRLSPRQIDVMRLLAEGRSVKEIARALNLGVGTVKVHLAMAYSALGAHNRVEAVRRAAPALVPRINGESFGHRAAC